jgi:signal transduction histidine kinase
MHEWQPAAGTPQVVPLSDERRGRRREAAEIHDAVVQGIVTAQLARRLGRHEEADATLDATLTAARRLVSRLLDEASGGRPQDAGPAGRRQ